MGFETFPLWTNVSAVAVFASKISIPATVSWVRIPPCPLKRLPARATTVAARDGEPTSRQGLYPHIPEADVVARIRIDLKTDKCRHGWRRGEPTPGIKVGIVEHAHLVTV